jgi:hypothetical protein
MHNIQNPTCPPEHLLRALRRPRWFQLRLRKARERIAYYRKTSALMSPLEAARARGTLYLIDEPTPWHSLSVWKEHLEDLRNIPDHDSPQVVRAIGDALAIISWIETEEPKRLADFVGEDDLFY